MEEFMASQARVFKKPEVGAVINSTEYDIEVEKLRFGKYRMTVTFIFPNGSSFTFKNLVRSKKKGIKWIKQVVETGLKGI